MEIDRRGDCLENIAGHDAPARRFRFEGGCNQCQRRNWLPNGRRGGLTDEPIACCGRACKFPFNNPRHCHVLAVEPSREIRQGELVGAAGNPRNALPIAIVVPLVSIRCRSSDGDISRPPVDWNTAKMATARVRANEPAALSDSQHQIYRNVAIVVTAIS